MSVNYIIFYIRLYSYNDKIAETSLTANERLFSLDQIFAHLTNTIKATIYKAETKEIEFSFFVLFFSKVLTIDRGQNEKKRNCSQHVTEPI